MKNETANKTPELMEIETGKYREMRDTLAQRIRSGDAEGALELLSQMDAAMRPSVGPDVKIVVNGGLVRNVYADKVIGVEVLDTDWPDFPTDEDQAELEATEAKAEAIAQDPNFECYW